MDITDHALQQEHLERIQVLPFQCGNLSQIFTPGNGLKQVLFLLVLF